MILREDNRVFIDSFVSRAGQVQKPQNDIQNLSSAVTILREPEAVVNSYSVDFAVNQAYINHLVFRCVNFIAQSVTSAYFEIQNAKGEPQDKHPLIALLNTPNPEISPGQFWQLLWKQYELCGNSYLLKAKIGNQTKELWPLFPDKMSVVGFKGVGKLIDHYLFENGGKKTQYLSEQVIHHKNPNPANLLEGLGPVKGLMKHISLNLAQDSWNLDSLNNQMIPALLLLYGKDIGPDELKREREYLRTKYASKKNNGKPLALQGVDEIKSFSRNAVEMDYQAGKKTIREEICNAFGVNPILVGYGENASLNNVREFEKVCWNHTLLPKLTQFAGTLTWGFRDELGEGNYITFNTKHIQALQADFSEVVSQASQLALLGVDIEEVNRRLDMGLNLNNINNNNAEAKQ